MFLPSLYVGKTSDSRIDDSADAGISRGPVLADSTGLGCMIRVAQWPPGDVRSVGGGPGADRRSGPREASRRRPRNQPRTPKQGGPGIYRDPPPLGCVLLAVHVATPALRAMRNRPRGRFRPAS